MRAIFISYRREDAEGQAGRLFDDLVTHFGSDAVFMDVAAIEPGRDFRRAIDEHVASCGVLLAIIGRNWLTAKNDAGIRRLDDPADFVRLETASALKRDIPVVPVLVHGASMPRAEDLPEDVKELAFRNGVELTHARWESDVQLLVKALRQHVPTRSEPARADSSSAVGETGRVWTRSRSLVGAALVAVLASGVGVYTWQQKSVDSKGEERAGNRDSPGKTDPTGRMEAPAKAEPISKAEAPAKAEPISKAEAPAKAEPLRSILSFRDWEGSWDLEWEWDGQRYGKPLKMTADRSGIAGDYVLGTLRGSFVGGDVSKVTGEIKNVTGTGATCRSGEQSGRFSLALSSDGKSMAGWWDVCGEGAKYPWKAVRRGAS